ncbi:MAG: hypothetical protein ACTSVY_03840 [Candidatus Helarchaeota archaeon]
MKDSINIFEEVDKTKAKEISDSLYNSARRYLLAFIYYHQPITHKDLKHYFKISSNLLSYHLKKLKIAGLIKNQYIQERKKNQGYSIYSVTKTGIKFLEMTGVKKILDDAKRNLLAL